MIGAKQFAGITFQLLYFCTDYPVYDISYSYFFCDVFIIYIFLLVSVCQRVVLNAISQFFFKQHRKCFLQRMRMRLVWWKICLTAIIRMRALCKHISAERKFNTVIPSLVDTIFWSGSTLMQECFKNIKWRDVDKKIRHLEFYVFGNVTVQVLHSGRLRLLQNGVPWLEITIISKIFSSLGLLAIKRQSGEL